MRQEGLKIILSTVHENRRAQALHTGAPSSVQARSVHTVVIQSEAADMTWMQDYIHVRGSLWMHVPME